MVGCSLALGWRDWRRRISARSLCVLASGPSSEGFLGLFPFSVT